MGCKNRAPERPFQLTPYTAYSTSTSFGMRARQPLGGAANNDDIEDDDYDYIDDDETHL